MTWNAIRGCGKVREIHKKIPLETGKIKTGEFLNEILREFAKVSTLAFDNIGDLLFAYRERQLSSILLPAFYNLGYSAMQEVPTRRRNRLGIDNHGWLDYWVQKDIKWTFLIEAKHGKHCFNRPLTDRNNRIIQSSIRQLRGIEGPNLEELSFDGKGFKIALTILPIYRTMSRVTDDDLYVTNPTKTDELESTLDLLVDGLAAKSSWVGVWSLPRRMQFSIPASWSESRMLTYPAVALVATVVT